MIPYFVLFDDNYLLEKRKKNRLFLNPIFVHSIYTLQDAESFLQKVHDASKNNYVALALSYEFGYAFESKLKELLLHERSSVVANSSSSKRSTKRSFETHLQKKSLPRKAIATFAVFDKVFRIDNEEVELFLEGLKTSSSKKKIKAKITQSLDEKKYSKKFAEIKKALVAGETYQVNFTFKKNYQLNDFCDLAWLYSKLRQAQPVPYGAFFHLPECTLMSRSPELFLKREGEKLMTRPMKGTLGKDDFSKKNIGKNDWKKLRAENLIIVDLLRNDLSKVAQKGTVNVKAFLDREKYKTIDQLTSTITCQLHKNTGLAKILTATFPCGSVTGAPKIKTMECIKKLEREPRGFYCGALGFVQPREKKTSSDFLFNVAIRTLIVNALDLQTRSFTFGVGAGVIVDSKSREEYFESCLKSVFLDKIFDKESKQKNGSEEQNDWQEEECLLFETMLAVFEGDWRIKNLEGHLSRLKRSADALNFSIFVLKIKRQISSALKKLKNTLPNNSQPCGSKNGGCSGSSVNESARNIGSSVLCKKVKLLLDRSGKSFLRIEDFDKISTRENEKPRVCLSNIKLSSSNALLRHKTTLRKLYESQFFLYGKLQGFADVIFFNEKNQLCEGSRHNIFLVKNRRWQTPDLVCGLLPGLMREQIIKSKNAAEKILYAKDLYEADQIYLTNSLRGCYEVVLK